MEPKEIISKALQSVLIHQGVKQLTPNMGSKKRLLLFVAVNEALSIMETGFEEYNEKGAKAWAWGLNRGEDLRQRWTAQDPDVSFSRLTTVGLGPTEES